MLSIKCAYISICVYLLEIVLKLLVNVCEHLPFDLQVSKLCWRSVVLCTDDLSFR
jgi:hypothetical protein